MKIVILVMGLLMFLALASSARAVVTHTCGGSAVASQAPDYNQGSWLIVWRQNCGAGKTVEVRVGVSTDGTHWSTFYDHSYLTSTREASHWVGKSSLFNGSCSHIKGTWAHVYRETVIWRDGVSHSPWVVAC